MTHTQNISLLIRSAVSIYLSKLYVMTSFLSDLFGKIWNTFVLIFLFLPLSFLPSPSLCFRLPPSLFLSLLFSLSFSLSLGLSFSLSVSLSVCVSLPLLLSFPFSGLLRFPSISLPLKFHSLFLVHFPRSKWKAQNTEAELNLMAKILTSPYIQIQKRCIESFFISAMASLCGFTFFFFDVYYFSLLQLYRLCCDVSCLMFTNTRERKYISINLK